MDSLSKPRVYWITGLPGVGKTTLARWLYGYLQRNNQPVLWLDGDELRSGLFPEFGYEMADRLSLALKYHNLAKMIEGQNINVVMSTVSMFQQIYALNRREFNNYLEVYLEVDMEILEHGPRRDQYLATDGRVSPKGLEERPQTPDLYLKADIPTDREKWIPELERYLEESQ